MTQVFSKIPITDPIRVSCIEYVHPWTTSCLQAICGLYLYSIYSSLKIYGTVYVLTLLMKGRIPTRDDLKKTLYGVLQSTAFLSGTAFGYSLFLCFLRRTMGNFNLLTVSAMPAFLSSVFSILIERPSRRVLLCLYVSNVATETVWNMLQSRGLVENIRYGDVAIFGASMAVLLTYYKNGIYKRLSTDKTDSIFGVLRFIVGPYEEKDYNLRQGTSGFSRMTENVRNEKISRQENRHSIRPSNKLIFNLINQTLRTYKKIIHRIKCFSKHNTCPHPFSCLYYAMQSVSKMFTVGFGLQMTLELVLNLKNILRSPSYLKTIFYKKNTYNLAIFLASFSGIFRAVMCLLRWLTNEDSEFHAIPAGLLAGIGFVKYRVSTVSLYVLWKVAQISYNIGIKKGLLPSVPGFTEFLYSFSTAILFHAAIIEPTNLRPSYWKFLHSISGGRIACMERSPLNIWGFNTSESLATVLKQTRTIAVLQF